MPYLVLLLLLLVPASAAIGWYLFRAPKAPADLPVAPPPEPVPDFVTVSGKTSVGALKARKRTRRRSVAVPPVR